MGEYLYCPMESIQSIARSLHPVVCNSIYNLAMILVLVGLLRLFILITINDLPVPARNCSMKRSMACLLGYNQQYEVAQQSVSVW